jgi:hypothetical protein
MLSRRRCLALLSAAAAPPNPAGPFRRVPAWTEAASLSGLTATADSRAARIVRTRSPQDDLLLLIVLDVVGDLTLVDAARQAAAAEIEKLPASAWVGVLRAQDGLRVLMDPSADRAATSGAILNAPVSGRAGLLESVEPAARLGQGILRKTGVRTAILYLTDSDIFNYREDYTNPVINMSDARDLSRRMADDLVRDKASKVATILAETDAPIFIVHLNFLRDRLNEAYQTGLRQIAEATGGATLLCRNLGDIPTSVTQAFEKIRSMWTIDLQLPGGISKNFTIQFAAGPPDLQYRSRFISGRGKE